MPVIKVGTRKDGNVKGADYEASVSLILDESEPGQGPRLQCHPYDETWVVQEGHLSFQCGEERVALGAGAIVVVPPEWRTSSQTSLTAVTARQAPFGCIAATSLPDGPTHRGADRRHRLDLRRRTCLVDHRALRHPRQHPCRGVLALASRPGRVRRGLVPMIAAPDFPSRHVSGTPMLRMGWRLLWPLACCEESWSWRRRVCRYFFGQCGVRSPVVDLWRLGPGYSDRERVAVKGFGSTWAPQERRPILPS